MPTIVSHASAADSQASLSASSVEPTNLGMISTVYSSHASSHQLLDSGASSQISCTLAPFITHTPLTNRFVLLPTKVHVPVLAIGTVQLGSKLLLYDVLYIPSFTINLISVSSLLSQSTCPILSLFRILNLRRLAEVVCQSKGLYYFDTASEIVSSTVLLFLMLFLQFLNQKILPTILDKVMTYEAPQQ